MGFAKTLTLKQTDILRLEAEINNLWGELNTSNIPHALRMDIEKKLSESEEEFKTVLGGQGSFMQLENRLHAIDLTLAQAAIQQAENEIPKADKTSGTFQALENIRHELIEGRLTPVRARHQVKGITRHYH